ncbi:MAG: EAL domain-containing protein [Pseudomonadota bacterium]
MTLTSFLATAADKIIGDERVETPVQLAPDALYVLQDGLLVFVSAAGVLLLRAAGPEELLGLPLSELFHPDFVAQGIASVAYMLDTGESVPAMVQKYLRRDGSAIDAAVFSAPFLHEGRPAVQVIARSISDRKSVEEALRVSHHWHQVLAAEAGRAKKILQHEKTILQMIALNRPLPEVLREICLGAERILSGDVHCAILLRHPDGLHLQVGAAPSLPNAYNHIIEGISVGPTAECCGLAMFLNKKITVDNIEHESRNETYHTAITSFGLRASCSVPIAGALGAPVGAFSIYYRQPRAPGKDDLAFIADISHLAGIAIQKDRVERSLQEGEERHRYVINALSEGIVMQSRDGRVLTCNASAERILRFKPNHLSGMRRGTYFKRVVNEHGEEIPRGELPSEIVLHTGEPQLNLVVGLEMTDGEIIWISENILPIQKIGESEPSAILISFTDISPIKQAKQRLRYMATHDALTELPNRAYLLERLSHSLSVPRSRRQQTAILFLDLDRFKTVNDTLGHDGGDRLLKMVAARLSSFIRSRDTLVRLGGDEFAVLVEGFDDTYYLSSLAERLLQSISDPFRMEDNEYYLGVSIGISMYPQDGEDGLTLLRCADAAMYHAKERGRNRYQFFTAELNARTQRRYLIEKNLRHALNEQEFQLHYQAKIELKTGKIVAAEALLRWENPELGHVPSSEFIPIAEETGLIVSIGRWAMEQACCQAVKWRHDLMPNLRMAVNLSPRQFQDENLLTSVTDILRRTTLPAHALELEITESLLMGDTEKLMQVFNALTALGLRFSLDDFGTGYSSLSYLQRFPIGNLKIDQSFISGIPANHDSVALTLAIIAMAQALHMSVTAEGVENQLQMDFLKQAGCQEMQGFYFSEPVSAREFEVFFR